MKTTAFFACAVAFVAIAGCNSKQGNAATNAPVKLEQVKPPKGGDWTQVVNPTSDGGFMMGNPNAKVKLIEIGSLTCPHCKAFEDEGVPTLMNTYVKSGQVSWQFRNYVRDAFDLTAALIVRCNGAKSFFPLTQAIYKDQEQWIAKIQAAPQDKLQQLQNLPENQQFVELAKVAGFPEWAAMRGVPLAKSAQCLSNTKLIDQVVQMNSETTNQFPAFEGTPTFAINGTMVPKVAAWVGLEPELKKALGTGG
jgi:protein-disulfide isomerase